jgi:cation diffusion facilitator CzcD-associated flavoprotein CzcO
MTSNGSSRRTSGATRPPAGPEHTVVIVGAGPGGICAGAMLRQRGIDDFLIVERARDFGGSWRDNDYPGIGVDVPGFTYQYSFAKNPDWSLLFPKGSEVLAYHQEVARRFGLYERARFGVTVVRELWSEAQQCWFLHTSTGEVITARFVISAVGAYILEKQDPGIEGYQDFAGITLRPTGWDHDYDLSGKRVAVIGTGASAVQIVPTIAPLVEHLDVFQRTPVWCLPKPDLKMPPWVRRGLRLPGVGAIVSAGAMVVVDLALRLMVSTPRAVFRPSANLFDKGGRAAYRLHLRRHIKDQTTREALMPSYGVLGKRPTLSNEFLRSFNRSNVDLHTTAIARINPDSVETVDGVQHQIDALVLATGYELFSDPESYRAGAVVGRDGFDLGTFYAENRLQAYQSVALPKLPNRWMLVGPYSWIGTGWHLLVEISAGHAVNVICEALRTGTSAAEVTQAAHDAYHRKILKQGRNIQYYFRTLNRGLRTYYVNSQGDMPYIRPTSLFQALRNSRRVDFADYGFTHHVDPVRTVVTDPEPVAETTGERGVKAVVR